MKKFFLWFFVIILLGIISFVLYIYFSPSVNKEPYKVIPPDAIYIIETSDLTKGWEALGNNAMWKHLKKSDFFKEINESASTLDSLIKGNTVVSEMFSNRQLLISAHMIDEKDYDFLFIVDLKKGSKITFLKDYINGIIGMFGYNIITQSFEGEEISILTDKETGSNLFISFIDNLMIASYSEKILQASILENHKENGGIIQNDLFNTVLSKSGTSGLFSVSVNFGLLSKFLNVYLSEPSDMANSLSQILAFSSLNIEIGEERIKFKGYTNINNNESSYIKAIMGTQAGAYNAAKVISQEAAMYLSLSFDDFNDFYIRAESEFSKGSDYDNITGNIEKVENFLKISLKDDFFSWIGNEIAFVMLKPSGITENKEVVVAVQATDIDKAKEGLDRITKQVKRRSPLKFRKINYHDFEIEFMDIKGFFRLFLGKLFDKIEKPFFTYIDDYVVFSNSPELITATIDDFIAGRTLKNNKKFSDFLDNFNKKSNVSIFIQMPKMYSYLYYYANPETKASLKKNREYIASFARLGFQLTSQRDYFETFLVSDYELNVEDLDKLEKIESTETLMNLEAEAMLFKIDTSKGEIFKDGNYQVKFETGNVQYEWIVSDGNVNGMAKTYWENGNVRVVAFYKDGNLDGAAQFFTIDGKLKAECEFKNNEIAEEYKEYYEDGKLKAVLEYDDGKADGDAKYYYPGGKIKIEGEFDNGLKDGKWIYYAENGKAFMNRRFKNGVEKGL